ncbi:MAG: F0F1 ATP synthase subunit A [Candidatus Dormibacteria bacterium]
MLADIDVRPETTHPTVGSGFWALNTDTAVNTLIVCGLFVLMALYLRFRMSNGRPGQLQNLLEGLVDFIDGLVGDTLGDRRRRIRVVGPLAISMFAFVVLSNWFGLLPSRKSPTNDVNTCLALALITVILLHSSSIRVRGPGGYVSHYFSVVTPSWRNPLGVLARVAFALLEVIQELAKPFTLSFRLYFNIVVGELMLALIIALARFVAGLGLLGVLGSLIVSASVGVVWILFSLFIGAVQAYILTMLTVSYVAQGTETHHDEDTSDAAEQRHSAPTTVSAAA